MAKKEESKKLLEREYIIPLKRKTLGVPVYRKAKRAVNAIKEFMVRHMKSNDISMGKYLNEHIWRHGMKNPPGKVKVTAYKDDKGKVFVELFGAPKDKPKEKKKGKKEGKKEAPKEAVKEAEIIKEEVKEMKEHKAEEAKKVEHEEIAELQREHPKQHAPKAPKEPKSQELRKKEMIPPQRNG